MPKFRNAYSDFKRSSVMPRGDSVTKQSFKAECDINTILAKYRTTGVLPTLIKENPRFGDFSDVPTYQEALNTVRLAQEQFDSLSSHVRERFANDPARFLEFVSDPLNSEELVKMGLATARPGVSRPDTELPKGKGTPKAKAPAKSKISGDPAEGEGPDA